MGKSLSLSVLEHLAKPQLELRAGSGEHLGPPQHFVPSSSRTRLALRCLLNSVFLPERVASRGHGPSLGCLETEVWLSVNSLSCSVSKDQHMDSRIVLGRGGRQPTGRDDSVGLSLC